MAATEQERLDERLREASWDNDVAAARRLVRRGANVNAKDATVQSAYLIATSEGYLELLRLTLRNGARVNDKDSWNGTGLIRAAERGHFGVVGELIQAGIDLDHVNRIGYQAIHEAVWLGEDNNAYATTLRVLVAGGVELDRLSGNERLTPLQMAQRRGYDGLQRVLLRMTTSEPLREPDSTLLRAAEAGDADPDALDDRHDTPRLVTGVTGSVAMLEALLPANPDLSIENRFGGLSVIPASERGHVDYVRRMVQTGIDVNHVNRLGWTALLEAVILGNGGPRHQRIVRILLDAGGDPTIPDSDGTTALEHARSKGYGEIARILSR